MPKPLFSCVLICRNEAQTLPRMMTSLKEFQARGGEVIVVDTGSTDGSAEIARKLGCKVTEVGDRFRIHIDEKLADGINKQFVVEGERPVVAAGESLFDFAAARNFAASLAEQDMISMQDCDEVYTHLDIDAINRYIEAGIQQFEYQFVFAHDAYGQAAIKFIQSKFYNRTLQKWVGVVHEVLQGEATRKLLEEPELLLEHWQNEKTDRSGYLKGLAVDCYLHPDNDRNSHYFGRECMYTGRYQSAIQELTRHVHMNRWAAERSQSLCFIAECERKLGHDNQVVVALHEAFEVESGRREPLIRLAEFYFSKEDHQRTAAYANAALTIPSKGFYADVATHYTSTPHELLYWAFWYLGDKEASAYHFEKALAYQPQNPKYLHDQQFYRPQPTSGLPFTGERVVPDKMGHRPELLAEHRARYAFAAPYTTGRYTLDAACGAGYGMEILKASPYLGVDVSRETIDHARQTYGDCFLSADLEHPEHPNLPKADVVVSFETLEHLSDPLPFLKYVQTHSELLVFSIPVNMPGEFHKQVYSIAQIKALVESVFPSVIWFSQTDTKIELFNGEAQFMVGIAVAKKLPKLTVLLPHKSMGLPEREQGLKDCVASIAHQHYPPELIELIVLDQADTVPNKIANGYKRATGDYIAYVANDTVLDPGCLLQAVLAATRYDKALVSFGGSELLPDRGNICEHFLIRRDFVPQLGDEIFCTRLQHCGCDNLLWAKCAKLNQAMRYETAVIHHHHFSKPGGKMDAVYSESWSRVEEDRKILAEELMKLES